MVQKGAVSGGAAVGQAFQPDSLLVRLESLTYGAKCYPGLNHAHWPAWFRKGPFQVARVRARARARFQTGHGHGHGQSATRV